MSIYVILDLKIHDKEKYLDYQKQAPAFIKKHGGKYIVRGGRITTIGEWNPDRIVMLEFPTFENAMALLSDPDYQSVKKLRDDSSTSRIVAVEGCDEDFPSI